MATFNYTMHLIDKLTTHKKPAIIKSTLTHLMVHTEKCIVMLTCMHVISNWSSFWKIANRKIPLNLLGYMLIQHNSTFTYSCKHGYHVRRTRNNSKGHSFWRLTWLLLCVYAQLWSGDLFGYPGILSYLAWTI